MFSNDAITRSPAIGLPVTFSMPLRDERLGVARCSVLMKSIAATCPSRSCCTTSGWSSRKSLRTMRCVVTYWPFGPQVALVDEDLAAALVDEARRPRLGHPGAVDVARLERVRASCALSCGRIDTSPPPAVSVSRPLLLQPGAQRDVLGVAELRRRDRLALQVRRASLMSGFTTRNAPPEVAPETIRTPRRTASNALMVGFGPM